MATVLKSNSIAKKYLSSVTSLSIPPDYRVAMDFSSAKFNLDGLAKTITDLLSVTRGSSAGYVNDNGVYTLAGVNAARIHNDVNLGKGLLIESGFTNLLSNPTAPDTQQVTLSISSATWLMLQVVGSGSCSVEIKDGNSVVQATGIATEATPFSFKPLATMVGATIKVTPLNISHFQLYTSNLPRKRRTQAGASTVASDVVLFNKSILASMLAAKNELTVIIKKMEFSDYGDISKSNASSGTVAQIMQEADTKGVFLARQKGGATTKGILRLNQTTETSILNKESISNEVFALTINSFEAKILQNGSIVSLPITEALALTRLYLGGGITWSTTFEHLIKEIYIYDRKLTATELANITI